MTDSGPTGTTPLGSANINTINEVFTVTVTPINAAPTLNPIPSPGSIPENSGRRRCPSAGSAAATAVADLERHRLEQ